VLFNSPGTPQFQRVSVPLVIGVSLTTAAVFFGIVTFAIRAQKVPIRTGHESLIGRGGVARSDLNPGGTVQAGGELWTAIAETGEAPIPAVSRVEIVRVQGVLVFVRKVGGQAD
jgi:membrane-bound serine protease (ClpP class)